MLTRPLRGHGQLLAIAGFLLMLFGVPLLLMLYPPRAPSTGVPAIQPTIRGAGPTTPAFTTQDVIAYARANNLGGIGPRVGFTTPPSISRIEFVTVHALSAQVPGLNVDLPGDTLLCYVEYRGTFMVSEPPPAPSTTWPRAFQVFDAHTGNQFATGTLPEEK